MSYQLTFDEANGLFEHLKKEYRIFAPKRFPKQGRYSDTDIIRYAEIDRPGEIIFDHKSTYSPKEVITPITETLFYFTDGEFQESREKEKDILIFARQCDINAQKNQDRIFLANVFEDPFYKRMRDKVKFVLIECLKGTDTCFCVSLGTNTTDDFVMATKCEDGKIYFQIKDPAFESFFEGRKQADFEVGFVQENETKVTMPVIPNKEVLNKLKKHKMWEEYGNRCIGCGSCTIACSTCTCFTTTDVMYQENGKAGERRRTAASCMIEGFDEMAGGHGFRSDIPARYRYKILHKIHDYNARFGEGQMCVGCGRCTDRCPELISYTATIEKVNQAVKEIMGGGQ